jgi:hypothetical protein
MNDDYSQTTSTTGVLTVGGSATGVLDWQNDEDWFRISLDAGQTYLFTFNGLLQGGGTLRDVSSVDFYLYDANGKAIDGMLGPYNGNMLLTPVLQFVPQASGTYFLGAGTYALAGTGSYTVTAAVQAPDDVRSDTGTSATLAAGGQAHARFEVYGDRDWYKFHALAGQHYTFTVQMDDASQQSPAYGIFDAHGAAYTGSYLPFEAPADGDYYISADGYAVGGYTLRAGVLSDDYARNNSTTGMLAVGGQVNGKIEYANDVDRFKISLQAGTVYSYLLTGDPLDQARLQLHFVDASGKGVSATGYRDTDGALHQNLVVGSSGDYYVDVRTVDDYYNYVPRGTYTLTSQGAVADDVGGNTATALHLATGGQTTGSLQWAADVDMFMVDLEAGVTYAFELLPGAGGGNPLSLKLSDVNGAALGSASHGPEKYYTFTPLSSGSYFASVQLQAGDVGGAYLLKTSLAPDDAGASAATAASLVVGNTVDAALQDGGGDRDWYAVSLTANTGYVISLSTIKLPQQYGHGGQIKVLDASGAVLASLTGNDNDSAALPFMAHATGTYYLEVSSPNRAVGNYQLGIQGTDHDQVGDDTGHATLLNNAVAVQGGLETGTDRDVFQINAEANHTYAIDLKALSPEESGWLANVKFTLTDASGNDVVLRPGNTQGAELYRSFSTDAAGSYYVTVTHPAGDVPRDYALSATSSELDDYEAWSGTKGVLPASGQVRGVFGIRGDDDWFKVHLEAGKSYTFGLHGAATGNGSLKTDNASRLVLYDSSNTGPLMDSTFDAHGEPVMTLLVDRSGDYFIDAQATGINAVGSYLLTSKAFDDTVAPSWVSTRPTSGASMLGLQDRIVLTFDEPIKISAGGQVSLLDAAGAGVPLIGNGSDPGVVDGNTLTIMPAVTLKPDAAYTLVLSPGSVLDVTGNAYAGVSRFELHTISLTVNGSGANDSLDGSGLGQKIDGGAGLDTVNYGLRWHQYLINKAIGVLSVQYEMSRSPDILTGVERLHFSDISLAFDIDGVGGEVYRLYQAAFNRVPDKEGLGFWMAAMDRGLTLNSAANGFLVSAEFQRLYGAAPTDAEYVNQLYHNVLHRDGEAGGTAFWLDALQHGHSRAEVLAFFSESPENQAALIGVIGNGFEYIPHA